MKRTKNQMATDDWRWVYYYCVLPETVLDWDSVRVRASVLLVVDPFNWMMPLIFLAIWAESCDDVGGGGWGVVMEVVDGVPEDTKADDVIAEAVVGTGASSLSPGASSTCKSSSTCSCKATGTAKEIMKTSAINCSNVNSRWFILASAAYFRISTSQSSWTERPPWQRKLSG